MSMTEGNAYKHTVTDWLSVYSSDGEVDVHFCAFEVL